MIWLIAVLGAAGAVCRYWVSSVVNVFFSSGQSTSALPLGTLSVNVLGSFLMGLLVSLFLLKFDVSVQVKNAVLIGFLGGFTTFSSFSLEVVNLLESQQWFLASLYILLSIVLCVVFCFAGIGLGRLIAA